MKPQYVQEALELMQERADDADTPMLDPGMFRRGWQDEMLHEIEKLGHTEDGAREEDAEYFAPYCDYEADKGKEHLQILFRHYKNRSFEQSPFRQVDRIRLIWDLIGQHLNIPVLRMAGFVAATFPLHDATILADLRKNWATNWRVHPLYKGQPQPLRQIRDYFGELLFIHCPHTTHTISLSHCDSDSCHKLTQIAR